MNLVVHQPLGKQFSFPFSFHLSLESDQFSISLLPLFTHIVYIRIDCSRGCFAQQSIVRQLFVCRFAGKSTECVINPTWKWCNRNRSINSASQSIVSTSVCVIINTRIPWIRFFLLPLQVRRECVDSEAEEKDEDMSHWQIKSTRYTHAFRDMPHLSLNGRRRNNQWFLHILEH